MARQAHLSSHTRLDTYKMADTKVHGFCEFGIDTVPFKLCCMKKSVSALSLSLSSMSSDDADSEIQVRASSEDIESIEGHEQQDHAEIKQDNRELDPEIIGSVSSTSDPIAIPTTRRRRTTFLKKNT